MIDQDFCVFLEVEICKAFEHFNIEDAKGFWCDGVLLSQPNSYYSQKFVNDRREIQLKAFIGKDGQSEYEVTLRFGKKSLSRYARNLSIKECVPSSYNTNWFNIDTKKNKLVIQLD
jgi:hypothetical protein